MSDEYGLLASVDLAFVVDRRTGRIRCTTRWERLRKRIGMRLKRATRWLWLRRRWERLS